jgi:uncharacterized membrane protein
MFPASRAQRIGLILLAAFFITGGILHFVFPSAYAGIMPPWLPWHAALVAISGVCEIAGGIGVLLPRTRHVAGCGLILLSLAVLPANAQMLFNYHAAQAPLWQQALLTLRLPLQLPLIWWIWRVTRAPRN